MAPEDPDLDLVRALQAGDENALRTLMDRYGKRLFVFIFRHIRNEADAFDLIQETFTRVYFNIGKFRPTAKFVTWLYRIALNLCRDQARRRARRQSQTISTEERTEKNERQTQVIADTHDLGWQIEQREKLRALGEAISELPQSLKSPLILTALEGRSHIEAGELLGISPKAVEVKVYRARKVLLARMQEMGF
jgi:RNA polymerase sigma-70 factor (ECF subfamily)